MKKLFFSLMALAAVSFGCVSCTGSDDDEITKEVKLETPKYADFASVYQGEGLRLELCEGGSYIAAIDTRATQKIFIGAYTVSSDGELTMSGALAGTINTKTGVGAVMVANVNYPVAQVSTTPKADEQTMKLCRTWNITGCYRNKVKVNMAEYAQYFGEYGAPKQLVVSASKSFAVVCEKDNYFGSWDWKEKGKTITVLDVPFFTGAIPFNFGKYITCEAVVNVDGKNENFKLYLEEVK